jgi:hypothetical protein
MKVDEVNRDSESCIIRAKHKNNGFVRDSDTNPKKKLYQLETDTHFETKRFWWCKSNWGNKLPHFEFAVGNTASLGNSRFSE